ncbi:MAG: hypothetical protein HGA27_06540 [Peptococcaceae bacterium]|nr:hypothetical protein [Peptococcaceae bacterium]
MIKVVLTILLSIFLQGCSDVESYTLIENEAIMVVDRYLESSVGGEWQKVFDTVSGEVLAQSKINSKRTMIKGSILKKEFRADYIAKEIIEVNSDISVKQGENTDRIAHYFKLSRIGGKWKIFKMSYGNYIRDDLQEGKINHKASAVVKEYFELPFEEKRSSGSHYFVGELKQEAIKLASMVKDDQILKSQNNIRIKVSSIDSMGVAKGFVVIMVNYNKHHESIISSHQAIVELLELENDWKIGNIEILK